MSEMLNEKSEEYLNILSSDSDEISIAKKIKSLILRQECSASVKVEFRKRVFNIFCCTRESLTDDNVDLIETAIEKCSVPNKKLDINFIKLLLRFYEDRKKYSEALKWIRYCPFDILNKERFGKNRYSDYSLFYLKKAKYLSYSNFKEELLNLESEYMTGDNIDKEVIYFIRYHLCKTYFYNNEFDEAKRIYNDLLFFKREQYLLILPVKYNCKKNIFETYLIILELLIMYNVHLNYYVYDDILNFFNGFEENELFSELIKLVKVVNEKVVCCEKREFNKILYNFILKNDKIKNELHEGTLCNITKSGNGFIKSSDFSDNIFIDKKLLGKLRVGDKVRFITFDSKDKNGMVNKSGIIIGDDINE